MTRSAVDPRCEHVDEGSGSHDNTCAPQSPPALDHDVLVVDGLLLLVPKRSEVEVDVFADSISKVRPELALADLFVDPVSIFPREG